MFTQNHFQQGRRYKLLISGFNGEILSGIFSQEFNGKVEFNNVIKVNTNTSLIPGVTNSILRIRKDDILSYAEDE